MPLARMRKGTAAGLALLVGLAILIPLPATARWAYGQWDFDIVDVSMSPSTLAQGNSTTLTVSIKNVGTEIGTVKVYAGIEKPDSLREYLEPHTIFDIPVNQTRSTSWTYTPSAGTGQYWVNFDVYSPPETHMFDTTGFVHSLTVTSPSSQSDPTATRSSPSTAAVTVEEGASQTFVANLHDADCDLGSTEWYLENEASSDPGLLVKEDFAPEGCSGSSSWTGTFSSQGTFEVIVIVYDSRGAPDVGKTSWVVTVTPAGTGGEPEECIKDGNSLRFSGHDWVIKDRFGGPGPDNLFDPDNVSCDENGRLHLRIRNQGGVWTSAEVNTTESFGFGTYEFKVSGDALGTFHDRVVLGLFNYPPAGVDKDGWDEIDIEFSRWGNSAREPGQFVVYPAYPSFRHVFASSRFRFDPTLSTTTHRFTWQSDRVTFESLIGSQQFDWPYQPEEPQRRIPQTLLPVHLNLWLYRGPDVDNPVPDSQIVGAETEIIIEDFSHTVAAMPASFRFPFPLG